MKPIRRPWSRRFSGAASIARRAADLWPLTATGLLAGLVALAALVEGRRRLDLVLSLAGAWGLVLLGLCGVLALLSGVVARHRLHREVSRQADPLRGDAAQRMATGARLSAPLLPLVAEPRRAWLSPPATTAAVSDPGRRPPEVVVPKHRDASGEILREFRVSDVFGLWSFQFLVRQRREVVILPARGRLVEAELAACLASGEEIAHPWGRAAGDRVDSRPYVRSDPARLILWKAYARSRELLVRTPEPARAPDVRPLLFLATGTEDEAAAAAARLVWESGLAGHGARFACDGSPVPTEDVEAGLLAIARSARYRARAGSDLAAALADPARAPGDPVLVVLPALAERTVGHVISIAGRAGAVAFSVLGVIDSEPPARPEPPLRRVLLRPRPGDAGGAEAPASLARAQAALAPLVAAGARVVLADRRTGAVRVVTPGATEPSAGRGAAATASG